MTEYKETDLFDFLAFANLQYRERGEEAWLDRCPFCEPDRQSRSDHFSFNGPTGQYCCMKCNAKGNLVTFKRELGYEPFKLKIYTKPDQIKVKKYTEQPLEYYQAFKNARGIPEQILQKYGVGRADIPGLGTCRTYQFVDVDGTVANVKYVNKDKKMIQERNAKQIYYGLQFVDFTKDYLHICEGEDDCHALAAMNIDNVVSVPQGAGYYSEEMGITNSKFKQLILLFDNDLPGQEGAQKFANKAGVWKCKNVLLPFKDARECLKNGFDMFGIQACIAKGTKFDYDPKATLRPAVSVSTRLERYERDAENNLEGIKFKLGIVDPVISGLRGGEVFTIVANPGCFKTTMLMNMLFNAIELERKINSNSIALFFSLEMQIEAEVEREIKMINKPEAPIYEIRKSAKERNEYWKIIKKTLENSPANNVYVSDENNLSVDKMITVIKNTECATGQKVVLVGIDYLDFISCDAQKEYDRVRECIFKIKNELAKPQNIPVILLAQTNRENKQNDDEVGARSGKGGTAIESTSDFQIGLWRDEDKIIGRFTKHRRTEYKEEFPYFEIDIDRKNYWINKINDYEKSKKNKQNNETQEQWYQK